MAQNGTVILSEITEELSKSYLDYAMSVIVSRALPDIRDGLKPVQRRILYAMHLLNLGPTGKFSKSAKIVGEVMGKYHPHGDSPVYEAMVRMAQDFSLRYPLVDPQGNFGSVDGDPPAAMRYTEARLSKIAIPLLEDIEKSTVNFVENFDATLQEPEFMPSLLPNMLLMGAEGIAVGMATKIPPHNLREVVDAIVAAIKKGRPLYEESVHNAQTNTFLERINKIAAGEAKDISQNELSSIEMSFETDATVEDLMQHIQGPDFPTGGAIYEAESLVDIYTTGRGKIVVRGIAEIKEGSRGKSIIEITELPYQVNKAEMVAHIASLVRDKKITGISTLRDESDKDGMSVVIELKRDSRPQSVLNNLYKQTRLQTSFPANMVALVNNIPYTVNLKTIVSEYIKHRQNVITRRTIYELTSASKRAHILEGLKIALDHLDEVIKTIRASRTQEDARANLIAKFGFTVIQANAILDMQLRRLAALEREKIEQEYLEIKKTIDRLTAILKDPGEVLRIISDEITKLKEVYGDSRRTRIFKKKVGEFSEQDLVDKKDVLITITKTGYIKMVPYGTYRSQRRGGKGVLGMTTKEEDEIEHLITSTTHDQILFFTNQGRVFGANAWDIPEASRQSKGQALVNFINLEQGEQIQSVVPMNEKEVKHLIMATKNGVVKKTALSEFKNLRSNGLIAIRLDKDDRLVTVHPTKGNDHILLVTKHGKSIRFPEANVRPMGRATTGVKGISLSAGDEVIAIEVFTPEPKMPDDKRKKFFRDILTITESGLGKRTSTKLFPVQKRAGKGVKAAVINAKSGQLASAVMVTQETEQVVMTSRKGQVIKLPVKNIPQMGRSTQGVILMRFTQAKNDGVSAVTALKSVGDNEE